MTSRGTYPELDDVASDGRTAVGLGLGPAQVGVLGAPVVHLDVHDLSGFICMAKVVRMMLMVATLNGNGDNDVINHYYCYRHSYPFSGISAQITTIQSFLANRSNFFHRKVSFTHRTLFPPPTKVTKAQLTPRILSQDDLRVDGRIRSSEFVAGNDSELVLLLVFEVLHLEAKGLVGGDLRDLGPSSCARSRGQGD